MNALDYTSGVFPVALGDGVIDQEVDEVSPQEHGHHTIANGCKLLPLLP